MKQAAQHWDQLCMLGRVLCHEDVPQYVYDILRVHWALLRIELLRPRRLVFNIANAPLKELGLCSSIVYRVIHHSVSNSVHKNMKIGKSTIEFPIKLHKYLFSAQVEVVLAVLQRRRQLRDLGPQRRDMGIPLRIRL